MKDKDKNKSPNTVPVVFLILLLVIIIITILYFIFIRKRRYPPLNHNLQSQVSAELFLREYQARRGNYPPRGPFSRDRVEVFPSSSPNTEWVSKPFHLAKSARFNRPPRINR